MCPLTSPALVYVSDRALLVFLSFPCLQVILIEGRPLMGEAGPSGTEVTAPEPSWASLCLPSNACQIK